EEGLPQSSVNALAQTADGYLWVGTYDGLARFDGARFEVLRPSNTPGLQNAAVRALLVDPEGRLWVGTGGGGVSLRDGGAFAHLSGTTGWLVRALARDHSGSIWAGTSNRGLYVLRAEGTPSRVVVDATVDSVNALLVDSRGDLWAGTNGQGLWRRGSD